jgi:hypothetical protein
MAPGQAVPCRRKLESINQPGEMGWCSRRNVDSSGSSALELMAASSKPRTGNVPLRPLRGMERRSRQLEGERSHHTSTWTSFFDISTSSKHIVAKAPPRLRSGMRPASQLITHYFSALRHRESHRKSHSVFPSHVTLCCIVVRVGHGDGVPAGTGSGRGGGYMDAEQGNRGQLCFCA